MLLYNVFRGLIYFVEIIRYLLLIYCILSWILPPQHKVMQFLSRFVDPLLSPIRQLIFRLLPRCPIDLSALVLFFVLNLVTQLIQRIMYAVLF